MKNIVLLKQKQSYKGKEYNQYFIKLPNNDIYPIQFPLFFSPNVKAVTKAKLYDKLNLLAEDYEENK